MPARTVDRREQGVEGHLAVAVEYIKIAESGDPERLAYEHAADEIIAAQREDPTLTQTAIGKRLGKSDRWVRRLLQARRRGTPIDWGSGSNRRDDVAKQVARDRPDEYVAAFEQAPPAAKRQIAEKISRAPEVRAAARQRDVEAERKRKPEAGGPRADHTLFQYESKLVGARRYLRDALALVDSIDQPGDDDDILELLAMLKQLVKANEEAYRSGKSLDTWAWELYERSAD